MTITIDVSPEEAERLTRQASRAGRDLPSFLRGALQEISDRAVESEDVAEAVPDVADAFFGIWRNRQDMVDSADWVAKERTDWQTRPTRKA